MFADIREPLILEWIQHHTSDGTFCRKSHTKEDSDLNTEKLTPGNEKGGILLMIIFVTC